mgnify:CR=1 FL=1
MFIVREYYFSLTINFNKFHNYILIHGFANIRIIDITRPYIPVDSATAAPNNIVDMISPFASG